MSNMSQTVLFYDDASRRQWESSIGIIHNTPKLKHVSVENTRLYSNPLKDKVDASHRPVSPLLNLDEDRMDIDEYADVAGHFFSNVMTTRVPSRTGTRPVGKKQLTSTGESKIVVRQIDIVLNTSYIDISFNVFSIVILFFSS
jgi:hypothetical protein